MRVARTILLFVLPLAAAVILGILGNLGVLQRLDGRAFDRLLRLRPAAPAAKSILLVDIDSQPGSLAGLLADGLVSLKEMDARYAVLDLPLAQKSPPALDPSVLRQTLPNALDREFSQMEENIQSLFDAIRRGSVRARDSARYVSDLVGLVGKAKGRLFSAAMGIERDDDALLGQAAAFFGRVYVPVGLLAAADFPARPELSELALQRQSIPVLVTGRDPSFHAGGIRPAVLPVVRGAREAAFRPARPTRTTSVEAHGFSRRQGDSTSGSLPSPRSSTFSAAPRSKSRRAASSCAALCSREGRLPRSRSRLPNPGRCSSAGRDHFPKTVFATSPGALSSRRGGLRIPWFST